METAVSPPIHTNKPKLQPLLHKDFGEEIPYYDEEFDLMQGDPHKDAISLFLPVFEYIASEIGKKFLSDQPAWYINPDTKEQNRAAGDIVLSKQFDASITTASDLEFVLEIVTTNHKKKEKKDTEKMYIWNEYNEVSEFCLYFPDMEDKRVLWLYNIKNGVYQKTKPDKNGMLCSKVVPGLCFRELPKEKWKSGKKIELWFQGEEIFGLGTERLLRKQAEIAKVESEIAKQKEQKRREIAENRANALAEKLKALGINPDD